MSLPRAVLPDTTYMITRRCSERRFFMRPRPETNNAFIYCLALAAEKYGVRIIFTATMSNHHHTGIVDVNGRLPDFLAYFHKLFAKHQNALYGRWEAMWASEQTSAVALVEPIDIFRKMVYALTNPVADHLVEKVHHWPGVNSLRATRENKPLVATRPSTFFRQDGTDALPKTVSLDLHLPSELLDGPRSAFIERLNEAITAAENEALEQRRLSGRSIVGRRNIRRQHWNHSPRSPEPHRQLVPRVACQNIWRRIETLARNRAWLTSYKEARTSFMSGEKHCFPAGTFWLRRFAGVACEPIAPS